MAESILKMKLHQGFLTNFDTPEGLPFQTCQYQDNQSGRLLTRRCSYELSHVANVRKPPIAGFSMQHSWAGHLCLSLNDVAGARQVDDGVFAACVQNGLGTTRGTLTGMAAAELACGQHSDLTDRFTVELPPRRLPPRPLDRLDANAILRWKEWRASAE